MNVNKLTSQTLPRELLGLIGHGLYLIWGRLQRWIACLQLLKITATVLADMNKSKLKYRNIRIAMLHSKVKDMKKISVNITLTESNLLNSEHSIAVLQKETKKIRKKEA